MNGHIIYQVDRPYNHFQSKSVIPSAVWVSQTSLNNEFCLSLIIKRQLCLFLSINIYRFFEWNFCPSFYPIGILTTEQVLDAFFESVGKFSFFPDDMCYPINVKSISTEYIKGQPRSIKKPSTIWLQVQ